MDKRQGGGGVVIGSVNMWAVLADDDSGDSHVEKRDGVAAEDKIGVPVEAAVPNVKVESSKKKKKKKKKKQAKKAKSAAVANGGSNSEQSEDEDCYEEAAAGDIFFRVLFLTALMTEIFAFFFLVA